MNKPTIARIEEVQHSNPCAGRVPPYYAKTVEDAVLLVDNNLRCRVLALSVDDPDSTWEYYSNESKTRWVLTCAEQIDTTISIYEVYPEDILL